MYIVKPFSFHLLYYYGICKKTVSEKDIFLDEMPQITKLLLNSFMTFV